MKLCLLKMAVVFMIVGAGRDASAIPPFSLEQSVEQSDVVVVGDVSDLRKLGDETLAYGGNSIPAARYNAKVEVVRVLKGAATGTLNVTYVLPNRFNGTIGIKLGMRVVFLRAEHGQYTLANPYYPSLPAVRIPNYAIDQSRLPQNAVQNVINEMSNVLMSDSASIEAKLETLYRSSAIPMTDKTFLRALQKCLAASTDPTLTVRTLGYLIMRNDADAVAAAANKIARGEVDASQKSILLDAIALHLTGKECVPEIVAMLRSHDDEVRIAAAEALWHIASLSATDTMLNALNDSNIQVRFYAVRALASATGDETWGPSEGEFQEHETKYLDHWRHWGQTE